MALRRAFLIFGRFQPPTVGHELLFQTALHRAQQQQADAVLFLSQTVDNKNPIPYAEKARVIKKSVPGLIIGDTSARTPAEALSWAFDKGYRDITMLVGDDRREGFEKLAGSWQRAEDPKQTAQVRVDALPRSGAMSADVVSGTVARRYAQLGDVQNFRRILISGAQDAATVKRFMEYIQARLGKLKESSMPKPRRTPTITETLDPQVVRVVEQLLADSSWLQEEAPTDVPSAAPAAVPTIRPDNGGSLDPEERVPEDSANNKSVLVLYPDRRLKYDTIAKVKEKRGDKSLPHHLKLQRVPQTRTK